VEQQSAALNECQTATQSVAVMADKIGSDSSARNAGQLASAAEQMSSTVQEISAAAAHARKRLQYKLGSTLHRGRYDDAPSFRHSPKGLCHAAKVKRPCRFLRAPGRTLLRSDERGLPTGTEAVRLSI
jgi:hypothetical protein